MTQLPLDWSVDKEFDLPPKWDGIEVTWKGWQDLPVTSLDFHLKDRHVCTRCGSTQRPVLNRGLVDSTVKGVTWPIIRFFAYRCPECRLDTVHDTRRDEWWDLDTTDYTSFGSVA